MTEHNEKLSYLLDDYRGDNPEATLDEVIGDVNLQYRMRRYQIIGDAMRHELPQAIDTDFHQSVMARIREQAEDSPQMSTQDSTASRLSWLTLRPFAGLAVAASVALVTVALWQPLKQESGQPDDTLVSRSRAVRSRFQTGCRRWVPAGSSSMKCPVCSRSSMPTW